MENGVAVGAILSCWRSAVGVLECGDEGGALGVFLGSGANTSEGASPPSEKDTKSAAFVAALQDTHG